MPTQVPVGRFSLFTQLPHELQDIIWKTSLSEPRSISGEDCFRQWWYGKLIRFLLPVALHVCHRSRSLAKKTLKRTAIHIPGLPGWKLFYLNQACDYFTVTKRDIQMNLKISEFVANPTLVNRVVISWGLQVPTKVSPKDTIHFFDALSGLEEVVLTDRARLYFIHQRASSGNEYNASAEQLALIGHIQEFFRNANRNISVSGWWFDGEGNRVLRALLR